MAYAMEKIGAPWLVRMSVDIGAVLGLGSVILVMLLGQFRTPLVPFVPLMGILCCAGLMLTLPADTWVRLVVWLLIGFVIYFGYGRRHSRLQRELAGRS
jgi:membrane protein implicated in regulation of membrane protease activity